MFYFLKTHRNSRSTQDMCVLRDCGGYKLRGTALLLPMVWEDCLSLTKVKCGVSRLGALRTAHWCTCGSSRTRPSPLPLPFSNREDKQKLYSWCVLLTTVTNSGESILLLEQNLQYVVSSLRKRQLIRILKNNPYIVYPERGDLLFKLSFCFCITCLQW